MSEEIFRNMAGQLRKPEGEGGKQIGEKMNIINKQINLRTIDELHIKAGENILELGMGNGFFVKEILSKAENVNYTGCDYSETMIAEASEINKEFLQNKKAEFFLSNAKNMPFEDQRFDKVFGVNIIYFWEDPKIELAEIHRILKSGGQLTIAVRPRESMEKYPFVKYGFTTYSKDELIKLLSENGFSIKNIIEEKEPAQIINDNKIEVEMLIVSVIKD